MCLLSEFEVVCVALHVGQDRYGLVEMVNEFQKLALSSSRLPSFICRILHVHDPAVNTPVTLCPIQPLPDNLPCDGLVIPGGVFAWKVIRYLVYSFPIVTPQPDAENH